MFRNQSRSQHKNNLRSELRRALRLEQLDKRELMAANVMDDSFFLTQEASLNVLNNDTTGSEVQNVSAFNADYDRSTYEALRGSNDTDWFIPMRVDPNDPNNMIPQRSLIDNAVMFQDGRADGFNGGANNGDVDLLRDPDSDPTNDTSLTNANALTVGEGMLLATLRENYSPSSGDPFGNPNFNVGVVQYQTENGPGAGSFIPIAAGPENNGERSSYFGAAFFDYSNGWVGASFNGSGILTSGSSDISVSGSGGRYEATVNGVSDSLNEGFLFSIGGDNEDNYTRTQPIEGGAWRVQHRDNAAEITGAEGDDFNLMYIPRNAQGLIGGVVNGLSTSPNAMKQSFGEFDIQREDDGLWRLNVPGHSPQSGVLVMETYDLTTDQPRNSYFSYVPDDSSDDFLIRQFAWDSNTENRLNTDFVFFFIPFENTLNPTNDLTVVPGSLGSSQGAGVSEQNIALGINADGTISYDLGDISTMGEGQTQTDTFTYEATDGTETNLATATVTWVGANDAPEISGTLADQTFNEDDAPITIDLTTLFTDIDNGDVLTFELDPGVGGLLEGSIDGNTLTLGPAPDRFGLTTFTVTAVDSQGARISQTAFATIIPQDDGPRAVDDSAVTTRDDVITIPAIDNDFHPETTPASVAAGVVGADVSATDNGGSGWAVTATSAAPNELTIQSAGNLGDVAVGLNGLDLSQSDGVLVGTAREDASPYATVNTYNAFGSYGFATDTGAGQPAGTSPDSRAERNTVINAGFFPYAEGWTSGQVTAGGQLLSGVGVSTSDVTKVSTGLYEVTIPGIANASTDGILIAMSGANDDNVMSVLPSSTSNTYYVRQTDSDDVAFDYEDDNWSFVFIPTDTPDLLAGSWQTIEDEEGILSESYGGVTASENGSGVRVSIPGYSSSEGALIAIATSEGGINTPSNTAVVAVPSGNDFQVTAYDTGLAWAATPRSFEFVFLPFAEPLERVGGLEISISQVDGTSTLGASVSLNPDGTIDYDPTGAGGAIAALQPGQTIEDTFTYTLTDARTPAQTSTGTITVTVSGSNQAPTANDDTINLNENTSQGAVLTVLGNDTDPDFDAIYGVPTGVVSANLSVDASSNWTVSQTGTAPSNITVGSNGIGDVEILQNGSPISLNDGLVLATIRENTDTTANDFRLVQAYDNGSGTSLALSSFGVDGLADANVAVSYFPFSDNWTGGHVDGVGTLTGGSGLAASNVVRTGTGRYAIEIPGVSDATRDGFLFVIGNEAADNVASARAVPGTNIYEVAVRDNTQDFANGEDGGFSFIFVPRNAENLVAGAIDAGSTDPNPVTLGVGEFSIERQSVLGGGNEWKLTIPGQTPDSGILLLTNQDNNEIEDNYLTYEDGGDGTFVIRNHDMPNLGRQDQPFTFMFVPFDDPGLPVARPVPGPFSVTAVDATSTLGATLSINSDGTLNYESGDIFASLDAGDVAEDTFSYTMDDGFGGSSTATVTVNISGVGATPTLTASDGVTKFSIGAATGVAVDGAMLVSDSNPFLTGAVLTVSNSGGEATDTLSVGDVGTVTVSGSDVSVSGVVVGTVSGGVGTDPLTVTFNDVATTDAVEAVARAVLFHNSDAASDIDTRIVTFDFTDGNGGMSAQVAKSVGLKYVLNFQEGVDFGFGAYTGTQDKELNEADAGHSQAQSDPILIDYNESGAESQALLRFDNIFGATMGQIPEGATIVSANLILETNSSKDPNASGDGARFFRMLEDWSQADTTWASLGLDANDVEPAEPDSERGIHTDGVQAVAEFESALGTASGSGATNTGFLSISVLPDVRAWAADPTSNFGWALKGWVDRTDGWFFSPSEDSEAAARPRLEIEYLPAGVGTVSSFREGVDGYASTVDTQISSGSTDDNSEIETLFVDAPTSSALLRFEDIIGGNTGQIPAGSKVLAARLRTSSSTSSAQGDGGQFYQMLTDWQETDNWDTLTDGISTDGVEAAADYNTAAGNASLTPEVMGGWHDWDVTVDVQSWVDGSVDNLGWAILPWLNGTDGWGFQSSEAGNEADRPRLEVFFTAGAGDSIAPSIETVFASSSQWTPEFIDEVDGDGLGGGNGLGVELTGSDAAFPWSNIDTFYVQFSEDVSNVSDATVELRDSTGVVPLTVVYDPNTFLGTFTVATPLPFSKLRLGLSDNIVDPAGNALDGDADGTAGGIFDIRFDVLPGDGNRDGRVDGSDLSVFSGGFLSQAGSGSFESNADWDGSGRVDGSDLSVFSENFLNQIGSLSDPAAPFSGASGSSNANSAFGSRYGNAVDGFFGSLGDDEDDDRDEDELLYF